MAVLKLGLLVSFMEDGENRKINTRLKIFEYVGSFAMTVADSACYSYPFEIYVIKTVKS